MAVNRLYLDLSTSDTSEYLVAGAYVASPEKWASFAKAWNAILADAGVAAFHATDFYAGGRAFRHIAPSSERHRELAGRFTGAAVAHAGVGVAFGLHLPTFRAVAASELSRVRAPQDRLTPEMFCVSSCLSKVATLALTYESGRRAEAILEDGPRMGGVIEYLKMQRSVPLDSLNAFTSFSLAGKNLVPLQAADLLAHESWRHIQRLAKPDGREMRKSLAAMLVTEQVEIGFADEDILRAELPRLVRLLDERPEYARIKAGGSIPRTT